MAALIIYGPIARIGSSQIYYWWAAPIRSPWVLNGDHHSKKILNPMIGAI
jgi:hypothetical protein